MSREDTLPSADTLEKIHVLQFMYICSLGKCQGSMGGTVT